MSCEIIKRIKEEIERDKDYRLLKNQKVIVNGSIDFKCAFTEKPKCDQPGGCSKSVLIIRDKGSGTIETYAVTRYKKDGWGYVPGTGYKYGANMHNWLDQECNGHRVVKWAYLPELSS